LSHCFESPNISGLTNQGDTLDGPAILRRFPNGCHTKLFCEVAKLRPPESRFGSQVVEMLMFVMSSGGPLVIWGRVSIT
jgi:hypothetical protein